MLGVYSHGPAKLHQALLTEQDCESSCRGGLREDIRWLVQTIPHLLPAELNGADTDLDRWTQWWKCNPGHWKKLIVRAVRQHLKQEEIMAGGRKWHIDVCTMLLSKLDCNGTRILLKLRKIVRM